MARHPDCFMTDQRRTYRKKTYLTAYVHPDARGPSQPCLVRNLSQTGARIIVSGAPRLPDIFDLHINGRPQVLRVQTMWRTATEIGVRLLAKIPVDSLEVCQAARMAPADSCGRPTHGAAPALLTEARQC